jgi:hypothetical protein
MNAMKLARPTRSVVALVTAIVLVLCQAVSAAQACAYPAQSARAEVSPCHEGHTPDLHGAPEAPAPHSACDTAKAYSESVKIPVLSIADLPVLAVVYGELPRLSLASDATQAAHAVCYSPPLTLLHCRLLN